MVLDKKPQSEDWAYVLDYLPYGSPEDSRPLHQKKPLVQSVGESHFVLMELIPKEGAVPETQDKVYLGEGDRDIIDHVKRRINYNELTHGAQLELPYILENVIAGDEPKYISFFSDAYPITNRLHMLELLPGIGKKLMWAIIDERKKGEFHSFKELTDRVKGLHTPEKLIVHRIIDELKEENVKYRLFTTPPKPRNYSR
jgi:putative nucleotide binding protein